MWGLECGLKENIRTGKHPSPISYTTERSIRNSSV